MQTHYTFDSVNTYVACEQVN